MKHWVRKWNYPITHLSLFQYSQFWELEISVALHFVVPNFDPHPFKNHNFWSKWQNSIEKKKGIELQTCVFQEQNIRGS